MLKKSKKLLMTSIILILLLQCFAILGVSADVSNHPSHAYVHLSANPIGVGQTLEVLYRVEEANPLTSGFTNPIVWEGFTVKITLPDGTVENKTNLKADATGGSWFLYTPTQAGNYTFQTIFPGQWVNGSFRTVGLNGGSWSNASTLPLQSAQWWYQPSQSAPLTLTVTQQPIANYPNIPFPTDYWTRPISAENKGIYTIADNWLMPAYDMMSRPFQNAAAFAPYTSGPNSPHILWAKPLTFGGIAGGPSGDKVFYTGLSYESFFDQKLIIGGRLYYQDHGASNTNIFGTKVLDLYTGELIQDLANITIDAGELFDNENPNGHGITPILWSFTGSTTNGTWIAFDAFTAIPIFRITNVTSGSDSNTGQSKVFNPINGEILSYSIQGTGANRRLILFNTTRAILGPNNPNGDWNPTYGSVFDGRTGIEWNVSIASLPMDPTITNIAQGYILTNAQDKTTYPQLQQDAVYPAVLQKDANGNYPTTLTPLWVQNRTDVFSNYQRTPRNIQNGVYTMFDEATARYFGYSLTTGQKLWVTEPLSTDGWSVFTFITNQAYGMLFSGGFDGHIRAFNITTGQKVWDFRMGPSGKETPFGNWPTRAGWTIADGKIYATNDDHTPDAVMWRGSKLYCIDAYTGQVLWNVSGWMRNPAISDGILTAINSYDNQIYTIGKGPSKTTVSVPNTAITLGQAIVVSGSVTDQTSGSNSKLKDTPAIADENMGEWMQYMYMNQPLPKDAKGVPVTISVTDSNGNYRNIGNTTTDLSGNFGFAWKPDIPGSYQIVATFTGSNSYGSSSSTAYFNVQEPPTSTTSPAAETPVSMAEQYFLPLAVFMIVAIIVIGAMLAILLLRKRP
jgi:hypothetical protein